MRSGENLLFDFGESPETRITEREWMAEVIDDDIRAQLADRFSITHGPPKLAERQALYNFFPYLSRGCTCSNGRDLIMEPGNRENPYWPDLMLRWRDEPASKFLAIVDVERKSCRQLFQRADLPINVPVLTMRAHRGETPYKSADGTWRKTGKLRCFEKWPEATFFLAVAPDATEALLVTGADVIAQRDEWIRAKGPFKEFGNQAQTHEGPLLVKRVPRSCAVHGKANDRTIENAVMNTAAVMAAVRKV